MPETALQQARLDRAMDACPPCNHNCNEGRSCPARGYLPIMFAGDEPNEADERKDVPVYRWDSFIPSARALIWAYFIFFAIVAALVLVMAN